MIHGDLLLMARIGAASNATFQARIGDTAVVYKPISGERPLWDFPDGMLAHREYAAWLVSEATGWDIVPETWLAEGPHGEGMVQRWIEVDEDQGAVDIVPTGDVPQGWLRVFDGYGYDDKPVTLIHEDTTALRRIAVFDALINNADRKGGHVLERDDGHRHGIDHGLTFHSEPKLRTVLWGWGGTRLTDEERLVISRILDGLDDDLGDQLSYYLATWDMDALRRRADALLSRNRLPEPKSYRHTIPWPPF
jgi:uncharacterized repeat protein (TIGR03843 family)